MKVLTLTRVILSDVLLQDPENMIWYTGHSLKLCCVVTIMQLETDTKPMHRPIYILGHVYGLKLILFGQPYLPDGECKLMDHRPVHGARNTP